MSERVVTVGGNKATRPVTDFQVNVSTEFFVGPNAQGAGDDGRSGRSKETSLATIEAAIALCTASKNDIIYLLPGHAETLSTAGAIALDKIGIRVIGLGTGALRPKLTFSNTAATLLLNAASTSIENVIIIPSVDSVVSPIVISAADCKVDVEIQDASAAIECVRAVLTSAGADRLDLKLKYVGFIAGNACVNAVRLVGCDTANIEVDFYGVASTGIVEFHTTACHNIKVNGKFYNSGTTDLSKNVVDTVGGSTWSVEGFDAAAGAEFAGGSGNAIAPGDLSAIASAITTIDGFHDVPTADAVANAQMRDAIGNKTDAAATVGTTKSVMAYAKQAVNQAQKLDASALGTVAAGSLAAYLPRCVEKVVATIPDNTTADLFTITGGPVRAKIVGLVTTVIGGAANGKLQHTTTTPAATVELNAGAVAIDSDAAGTIYQNVGATSVFTPSSGLGFKITDPVTVEEVEFILAPGTVKFHSSATQTGAITWYMSYVPLTPNALVVAAS